MNDPDLETLKRAALLSSKQLVKALNTHFVANFRYQTEYLKRKRTEEEEEEGVIPTTPIIPPTPILEECPGNVVEGSPCPFPPAKRLVSKKQVTWEKKRHSVCQGCRAAINKTRRQEAKKKKKQ